jgi:hypothetical protein
MGGLEMIMIDPKTNADAAYCGCWCLVASLLVRRTLPSLFEDVSEVDAVHFKDLLAAYDRLNERYLLKICRQKNLRLFLS